MANPITNPDGYFSDYMNRCVKLGEQLLDQDKTVLSSHLETRARKGDLTDALRFRIHDPLWTLSRQWQMGEFRGNDAGTAMSVRYRVASTDISTYRLGKKASSISDLTNADPLEPTVEQINREITPLVRVESATYFRSILAAALAKHREDGKRLGKIMELFREKYPLKDLTETRRSSLEHDDIRAFTESRNTRLQRFSQAFSSKAFDGYALYLDMKAVVRPSLGIEPFGCLAVYVEARRAYIAWFEKRYLPKARTDESAWDQQQLGYDFSAENSVATYKAHDYSGGRVSWYSFDVDSMKDMDRIRRQKDTEYERKNMDRVTIETLPVLASYPGSPNKRLWEFENRDVFMGNSKDMQAKGNVAFMQFATMYGNDWMLCPLKTEIGRYIEVESIEVYDTFGIRTDIVDRAGLRDQGAGTFGQRWQMFTNAPVDENRFLGYKEQEQQRIKKRFANGLMFPPALIKTLEGESLEEVSLLRDEMANMVWGVETRIEDGCGSSLDASLLASEVGQFMEDTYHEEVEKVAMSVKKDENDLTQIESGHPADVPQHLFTEEERAKYEGFQGGRETILRRGKMPYFFDDQYWPVRPLSSILQVVKREGRTPDGTEMEVPMFINEEEVQGVGTVIRKNCQRSRWLDGRTYTWMGYSKGIKYTQGVSGLEFDNLLDPTR